MKTYTPQELRKKIANLEHKYARMSAWVPPPIRLETAQYLARLRDEYERMTGGAS